MASQFQVPTSQWPPQQETTLMDVLKAGLQSPNQEQADQLDLNNENLKNLLSTFSTENDTTGRTKIEIITDILHHQMPILSDSATTIKQTIADTTTVKPNGFLDQSLLEIHTASNGTIEAVKDIITKAVTPQTPLITTASNSTVPDSMLDINTAANTSEIVRDIIPTTTESIPNIYTTLRDMLTTTKNKSLEFTTTTKLPDMRTTIKEITENSTLIESSTAKEVIGTVATTESPMFKETSTLAETMIDVQTELNYNVTSTIKNIFGIPQEPITESVTHRSLNAATEETISTVKQVVQNVTTEINVDSNYSTDSITSTVSSVTKNFLDNTVDDGYVKKDDDSQFCYIMLGVIIIVIILLIIGLVFLYRKLKKNKKLSAYQVSQMNGFDNSTCSN